jgi:hypothetical protein
MLVEKKMGWTLGGKFELPTWFITLRFKKAQQLTVSNAFPAQDFI